MQRLTDAGDNFVNDLSNKYNLSRDAVIHMLVAVNNGGLSMAQFNCPELGGSGQWMQGGMTMVGDMFNHGLKATVDNLCNEIAIGLSNMQIFPPIPAGRPNSSQWWPAELGTPSSSGAQNNTRYAVFPGKLAIQLNNQVTIYNTLNHDISGVSQQQGGDDSLTFSSQFGTISVNQLPKIFLPDATSNADSSTNFIQPTTTHNSPPEPQAHLNQNNNQTKDANTRSTPTDDTIELIGKLAKLRDEGALTEQDFDKKKTELLARI